MTPKVRGGGGSCMVWGAFSASGVGQLDLIDGIIDSKKVRVSSRALTSNDFILF